MLRRAGAAIYRGVFWTYDRGTWQYDVMVGLILAFIFLTPRAWFRDRPLEPLPAAEILLLLDDSSHKVYQVSAALLDADAQGSVVPSAKVVLEGHTGKSVEVVRAEPSLKDSHGRVVSYAVWVREKSGTLF
jgi:hypothetical protein